jgi:hypothetical protein
MTLENIDANVEVNRREHEQGSGYAREHLN